jgi:(S)-2-hydroxyglutarate dehydrogenase
LSEATSKIASDVVIVGAGLLGLATARELLQRQPGVHLAVVEKEGDVTLHQSGRNSGVIHSGIYYTPGSLKAQLCLEGSRRLKRYCDERSVPYVDCGKLIVATREGQLPGLAELYRRAVTNQVPGLTQVDADAIRDIEPEAIGIRAIHCASTAIVDYRRVAATLREDIIAAGGQLILNFEVSAIDRRDLWWHLRSRSDVIATRRIITCAGLHADRIAQMTRASPNPRIVPFRGDYWALRPDRNQLVRGLIYPVPDPGFPFLGVHATKRIDGSVWLGPNAVLATAREGYRGRDVSLYDVARLAAWPGLWRMAARYWRTGLGEAYRSASRSAFVRAVQRLVPAIQTDDVVSAPAGVRAQALDRSGRLVDDFVFSEEEGVLHVRNAPSPAATSCLAIAEHLVDRVLGGVRQSSGAG